MLSKTKIYVLFDKQMTIWNMEILMHDAMLSKAEIYVLFDIL